MGMQAEGGDIPHECIRKEQNEKTEVGREGEERLEGPTK